MAHSDNYDPINGPHEIRFVGGPLDGRKQAINGQLPFRQFMIDGTLDAPVFHSYCLSEEQAKAFDVVPPSDMSCEAIEMRYEGTIDFFQMADIVRMFQSKMGGA